jgi:hypothetical protein
VLYPLHSQKEILGDQRAEVGTGLIAKILAGKESLEAPGEEERIKRCPLISTLNR